MYFLYTETNSNTFLETQKENIFHLIKYHFKSFYFLSEICIVFDSFNPNNSYFSIKHAFKHITPNEWRYNFNSSDMLKEDTTFNLQFHLEIWNGVQYCDVMFDDFYKSFSPLNDKQILGLVYDFRQLYKRIAILVVARSTSERVKPQDALLQQTPPNCTKVLSWKFANDNNFKPVQTLQMLCPIFNKLCSLLFEGLNKSSSGITDVDLIKLVAFQFSY